MAGIFNGHGVLCKVGYKLTTRRSTDWEQRYSHLETPGSQFVSPWRQAVEQIPLLMTFFINSSMKMGQLLSYYRYHKLIPFE